MKCKHVHQRLLATSGRRKLSGEVLAHLEGCERCRRWQTQLGLIDRAIPMVPVPDSSEAKSALIAQILEPAAPAAWWPPRRWRRRRPTATC